MGDDPHKRSWFERQYDDVKGNLKWDLFKTFAVPVLLGVGWWFYSRASQVNTQQLIGVVCIGAAGIWFFVNAIALLKRRGKTDQSSGLLVLLSVIFDTINKGVDEVEYLIRMGSPFVQEKHVAEVPEKLIEECESAAIRFSHTGWLKLSALLKQLNTEIRQLHGDKATAVVRIRRLVHAEIPDVIAREIKGVR